MKDGRAIKLEPGNKRIGSKSNHRLTGLHWNVHTTADHCSAEVAQESHGEEEINVWTYRSNRETGIGRRCLNIWELRRGVERDKIIESSDYNEKDKQLNCQRKRFGSIDASFNYTNSFWKIWRHWHTLMHISWSSGNFAGKERSDGERYHDNAGQQKCSRSQKKS